MDSTIFEIAPEWDSWLLQQKELYNRRSPGATCLSALKSGKIGRITNKINQSKGCGGIMRTAPVGLLFDNAFTAFKASTEIAAITHGHPPIHLT